MRFSLSKIFVAIAVIALGCAGLVGRSQWWMDAIVTLTILLFAWMALRAIGLQGRDRAFCQGFALIGVAYLVLAILSMVSEAPDLLLTNLLFAVAEKYTLSYEKNRPILQIMSEASHQALVREYGYIFVIGHCMFSWLFALIAGYFARWLYSKHQSLKTD